MRLMMCRRESLPGSPGLSKCEFAAWAEGMLRMLEWPTCSVRQQQLLQNDHLLLYAYTAIIASSAVPWLDAYKTLLCHFDCGTVHQFHLCTAFHGVQTPKTLQMHSMLMCHWLWGCVGM